MPRENESRKTFADSCAPDSARRPNCMPP
jgi:hypothetical protein